jgi:hypothetical protein
MKRWDQRPVEIRNLFNPAFCGIVLFRSLVGFEEEDFNGMPFSLALLILPLCLQKDSREMLHQASRSYLLRTIESNPQILVGFGQRTSDLIPFAFEALGLLLQLDCITISDSGKLKSVADRVRKSVQGTSETIACQRVARYVGREFARISDRVTIYTSFGIRP